MKSITTSFLLLALLSNGCCTHSKCRSELYQSTFTATADAAATMNLLDRGNAQKTHDYVTATIALRLYDLHKLSKDADKADFERQVQLAHLILKHAAQHREELLQDTASLQMVVELKSLVTNAADIQSATDLAHYLSASSTNQVLFNTQP